MRLIHSRFLSCFLLATYAGISLLGEGLHYLLPEEHHHHHGLYVVSHSGDEAEHAGHDHDVVPGSGSGLAELTASDGVDSHLCEICAFLYEAVSQPAEIATPIDWQPLIVAAPPEPQPVYSLAELGCPAARGPPLLMA